MKFTGAQQKAIAAKGNTLVIAGAGTGKTRTLVERCVQHLLDPRQNILLDEILMVTFTEAAAAEMRFRIRERLESALQQDSPPPRLHEQLALLDSAYICTLHSFCYQLIREHFYELELDPQIKVLAEEQSKLLAAETLDEMFETHYAGETPAAQAVQKLLQEQTAGGWDVPIRELILQLHTYTQTRPDPAGWFTAQLKMFLEPEPAQWRQWLLEGVRRWRELSLPLLQGQDAGNGNAQQGAKILMKLGEKFSRAAAAGALEQRK